VRVFKYPAHTAVSPAPASSQVLGAVQPSSSCPRCRGPQLHAIAAEALMTCPQAARST
jgi:hypothetical protein